VFVQEVAKCWVEAGHHTSLVCSEVPGLSKTADANGLHIYRVGKLKSGAHHFFAPRHMAVRTADVVLESINTIPYELPLLRQSRPFISLFHQMAVDVWDAHLRQPFAAGARVLERLLLRPYRTVPMAAVSESTRRDLLTVGVKNITVIPQGGIGEQIWQEKEAVTTFLFVGRLTQNKRPDHALEAFRLIRDEIPHARLWVVGEGPMRANLESAAPPGVELLGRIARDDLLARMSRAHLLLVTSVREGWGLVVTEANSMGTPAAAYDVPGLRDSIEGGSTGVLVRPSPHDLAGACVKLLRNRPQYEGMREHAGRWGASRTWQTTAAHLLDLLERRGQRAIRATD
jgi:glycosyltransferase involved in cell wall biosynthesis